MKRRFLFLNHINLVLLMVIMFEVSSALKTFLYVFRVFALCVYFTVLLLDAFTWFGC